MAATASAVATGSLTRADLINQNLESKPEFNCLGGRAVKFYTEKNRYAVRIHYTGRTLLIKAECCALHSDFERSAQTSTNLHSGMAAQQAFQQQQATGGRTTREDPTQPGPTNCTCCKMRTCTTS